MAGSITVERDGRFEYLAAESYVIGIGTADDQRKVCYIQFGGDGSIYVCPTFTKRPGVLSEVSYTKDPATGAIIRVAARGRIPWPSSRNWTAGSGTRTGGSGPPPGSSIP
jgi:hypothetical protein